MLVWWASEVECASAIARLEREGALDESRAASAFGRLREVTKGWHEVDSSDVIRETAVRFPARAPDARRRCTSTGRSVCRVRTPAVRPGTGDARRANGRGGPEGRIHRRPRGTGRIGVTLRRPRLTSGIMTAGEEMRALIASLVMLAMQSSAGATQDHVSFQRRPRDAGHRPFQHLLCQRGAAAIRSRGRVAPFLRIRRGGWRLRCDADR